MEIKTETISKIKDLLKQVGDLLTPETTVDETPWMTWMTNNIGQHEIAGQLHNQFIVGLFQNTTLTKVSDDETPWCAACVSAALERNGYQSLHTAWAPSYANYGAPCELKYGAVLTIQDASGNIKHVTFFAGIDEATGKIKCLGGNQSNSINVTLYDKKDIKTIRWPIKASAVVVSEPVVETPKVVTPEPVKVVDPADYYNRIAFENPDVKDMWDNCKLDEDQAKLDEIKRVCDKIVANKFSYYQVQLATNVPWRFIGAIHYRESDMNFNTCLHNGQPWNHKTTIVPIGRGPWNSWYEAAIDAIKYDGLDKVKAWDIPTCLQMAEKYNGTGYRRKGVTSPYVWAYTNMSKELGRYVSDGVFDANSKATRPGVAAIFKYMEMNGMM